MKWLIKTENDLAALFLRILLGVVMFPHGAQKALGWYGGGGFSGTMGFFTTKMGIPYVLALLVIAAEFLGSLGLIAGLLTRVAAFGIFSVMVGAIYLVHWKIGFFMNWFGKNPGEGYEYHLLAIAIALALMIKGGGALSVDRAISREFR
ncbi:MAG: DoxX family membrane protein [Deltaproteobacteria bacterium]|nr:DoxX family membrane protein [Deltaproteobacteria bacterium]NIS76216.1 DoxX family membrane protein [Deltaproteobacteria bacterium]